MAVVSTSAGLDTTMPRTSACVCMRSPFAVAPPSTRSLASSSPPVALAASASFRIASRTSLVWKQMASSSALARCALVENCVRPTHTPRASERHLGANRPLNAGTKYTPPVSGTDAASASTSDARSITPRLSRNHCTPAPAMATEPSSAYAGAASAPNRHATVVNNPCEDGTGAAPVLSSMKHPVPYVFFASPGAQRCPNVAAC